MHIPTSPPVQRAAPRTPAPGTVWLHCHRGESGNGADLANGLVDLSAGGLQFLSRESLTVGEVISVQLCSIPLGSLQRDAEVRWVAALGAGACCAGACFREPLSAAEVDAMVGAPMPTADQFVFE